MQFLAVLAMAAVAQATYMHVPQNHTTSTVTDTITDTITYCKPTVTNCPAHSTVTTVYLTTYTTVCPVTEKSKPVPSSTYVPVPPSSTYVPPPVYTSTYAVPSAPSSPIYTTKPVYPTTSTYTVPAGTASSGTVVYTPTSSPISTGAAGKTGIAIGAIFAAAAAMAL